MGIDSQGSNANISQRLVRSAGIAIAFILPVVIGFLLTPFITYLFGESANRVAPLFLLFVLFVAITIAWLVLIISNLIRFVNCEESSLSELVPALSPLLIFLFTSSLAGGYLAKNFERPQPVVTGDSGFAVLLGQDVYYDTILLPIFPDEGRIGSSASNCSLSEGSDFSRGLDVIDEAGEIMDYIAPALVACGINNQTRVQVRGFASSSEFRSCPLNSSDELNRRLAVRRAEEAARLLREAIVEYQQDADIEGMGVLVEPYNWRDFPEMQREKLFRDRPNGESSRNDPSYGARSRFTRRAEILFIDKGDCSIEKSENPQPALPDSLVDLD